MFHVSLLFLLVPEGAVIFHRGHPWRYVLLFSLKSGNVVSLIHKIRSQVRHIFFLNFRETKTVLMLFEFCRVLLCRATKPFLVYGIVTMSFSYACSVKYCDNLQ